MSESSTPVSTSRWNRLIRNRNDGMSDEEKRPSFIKLIRPTLIVALCALLAPFLILASAYAERKIAGTRHIEDACTTMHIHDPLGRLERMTRMNHLP
jgi:hypothetical protein